MRRIHEQKGHLSSHIQEADNSMPSVSHQLLLIAFQKIMYNNDILTKCMIQREKNLL